MEDAREEQQQQELLGNLNDMDYHYRNPKLNRFDQNEIDIGQMQNKTRLMIRIPTELTRNGIFFVMKQFGDVIDVDLHNNTRSINKRAYAFVEYRTFAEAEKALRELNSIGNKGLEIQANFAYVKAKPLRNIEPEQNPNTKEQFEHDEQLEEEDADSYVPVTVKFREYSVDNDMEKVTDFEYKKPTLTEQRQTARKELETLAKASEGKYDVEKKSLDFNENLPNNFLTFYCYVCDRNATLKCMLNGTKRFFCSHKCLKQFKNEGDEMPRELATMEIKRSERVCITAVMNTSCVYVRHANENAEFTLDRVYKMAKNAERLDYVPETGEHVLVKLFDDVFRALVLHSSPELDKDGWPTYIVRLIDIGNTATAKQEDLFAFPKECVDLKVAARKVTLKNVDVEAINADVIEYLMHLVKNKTELVIRTIDEDKVELREDANNTNVNQRLMQLANYEHPDFSPPDISFHPANIPPGRNKKLLVLNTADVKRVGEVVCIDESRLKDFYELYRAIDHYAKKVDPKTWGIPPSERPALVKCNDQWHRGLVVETRGDGWPLCHLLDLQLNTKININNMFPLPKTLALTPIYTEACKIRNYNPVEKKTCDVCFGFLCEMINGENQFIVADQVELVNDEYILQFNAFDQFLTTHQCQD